jgi:hypothetical protein
VRLEWSSWRRLLSRGSEWRRRVRGRYVEGIGEQFTRSSSACLRVATSDSDDSSGVVGLSSRASIASPGSSPPNTIGASATKGAGAESNGLEVDIEYEGRERGVDEPCSPRHLSHFSRFPTASAYPPPPAAHCLPSSSLADPMPTLVCTGCNAGLGLEALKTLLATSSQPWRVIIGSRSPDSAQHAVTLLSTLSPTRNHRVSWLPLNLAQLSSVKTFVADVEKRLGEGGGEVRIDVLLLNAGVYKAELAYGSGVWCEEAIVNHFGEYIRRDVSSPTPVGEAHRHPTQHNTF